MEQAVRDYLTACFKQPFHKRTLDVDFGPTKKHQFDAVSEDGTIVAEVKHYLGGQAAQLTGIAGDLARLSKLENRERKFLFITDPVVFWLFCRANQAILMEVRRDNLEELVPPMEFLDI